MQLVRTPSSRRRFHSRTNFSAPDELGCNGAGRGTQGYMQHPILPQMMQVPMGRGRPARVRSPAEESPDSVSSAFGKTILSSCARSGQQTIDTTLAPVQYNFNITEACERPEQARKTLMLRNIPNKWVPLLSPSPCFDILHLCVCFTGSLPSGSTRLQVHHTHAPGNAG